jgi:hypothetical protein
MKIYFGFKMNSILNMFKIRQLTLSQCNRTSGRSINQYQIPSNSTTFIFFTKLHYTFRPVRPSQNVQRKAELTVKQACLLQSIVMWTRIVIQSLPKAKRTTFKFWPITGCLKQGRRCGLSSRLTAPSCWWPIKVYSLLHRSNGAVLPSADSTMFETEERDERHFKLIIALVHLTFPHSTSGIRQWEGV